MPRDSHTITRFSGVNKYDGLMNVKPRAAIESNNVITFPSGELWAVRLPSRIIDFTQDAPLNKARIASLGLLDDQNGGHAPRLIIQQGEQLVVADAPGYANPQMCSGAPLTPDRLSHIQANSVAYFSNGKAGGKLLPGSTVVQKWGIDAPLVAPMLVASTTLLGVVSIQRTAGVVSLQFANPHGAFVSQPVYVDSDPSATWPATLAGTFAVASVPSPTQLTYAQPGLPDAGPFTRATFPPGLTAATGYQYRGCFGNSTTGHWSTASDLSLATGPLASQSPVAFSPLPPDDQVDQFALFRNLDDGGDWYLIDTYPLPAAGPFPRQVAMLDTTSDDVLESSAQTPPYDNGVSPNGKYLCSNVDRILMCGIEGNPGAVAFSGYDSINFGRPQESWPIFNRLQIGEGQTSPNAIGLTRYGAVIFTSNKSMYIVRGTLSDVTTSAVQTPSFKVDELPFKIGCYSHFAVQSSPSGLIFLDDSFQLRLFDGYYEPTLIAPMLSGIFRRITPGSQDKLTSAYVALEDVQWYILSLPVDGSPTNNLTVILDTLEDQERNTGAWVTDLPLDDVVSVLNRDGSRHLICAQSINGPDIAAKAGWVTEFPLSYSLNDPPASVAQNARWRSGYFGIKDEDGVDEWAFYKLFRSVRVASLLPGVRVNVYLVDEDQYTFSNPYLMTVDMESNYGAVNRKARACSVEIIFPPEATASVSALTQAWVATGKR